jgi:hypothetical protein
LNFSATFFPMSELLYSFYPSFHDVSINFFVDRIVSLLYIPVRVGSFSNSNSLNFLIISESVNSLFDSIESSIKSFTLIIFSRFILELY